MASIPASPGRICVPLAMMHSPFLTSSPCGLIFDAARFRFKDPHGIGCMFRIFNLHDRIGPSGNRRTGHDPDGLPRPDGLGRHLPCRHILNDRQGHRL